MSQLAWIDADSNVTPDSGRHRRQQLDPNGGSRRCARRRRRPSRRCWKMAAASLGVPGREPVREGRRRVRRGQDGDLRPADRRQALQHADRGRDAQPRPGRRPSAGAVPARRHEPAADRHPGQGHRQVHVRPQRPRAPACSTPASCGRAARPRTASAPSCCRWTRARSRASPTSRSCGRTTSSRSSRPKEYDAIRAAASSKVTWDETAKLPTSGNLFGAMRDVQTDDRVSQQSGNVGAAFASAAKVLSRDLHGRVADARRDRPVRQRSPRRHRRARSC